MAKSAVSPGTAARTSGTWTTTGTPGDRWANVLASCVVGRRFDKGALPLVEWLENLVAEELNLGRKLAAPLATPERGSE